MALHIAAAVSLAVWLYLLLGRGGFWRMRDGLSRVPAPSPLPRVAIVVPARNEADVIGRAIESLAAQDYAGPVHLIVVDDHSTDGTAAIARGVAATDLTVLQAEPLQPG